MKWRFVKNSKCLSGSLCKLWLNWKKIYVWKIIKCQVDSIFWLKLEILKRQKETYALFGYHKFFDFRPNVIIILILGLVFTWFLPGFLTQSFKNLYLRVKIKTHIYC